MLNSFIYKYNMLHLLTDQNYLHHMSFSSIKYSHIKPNLYNQEGAK